MNRRSAALVTAFVLFLACAGMIAIAGVPYIRYQPGPTVNVLGERDGEPIVTIEGARRYPTDGQLRMTTVSSTRPDATLGLVPALLAWVNPSDTLYPFKAIYPDPTSNEQEVEKSHQEMVDSQDHAVAAAFLQLGYDVTSPQVSDVSADGPSNGILEPGDIIDKVDGKVVSIREDVARLVSSHEPGSIARLAIQRDKKTKVVKIETVANPQDPERAMIGVTMEPGNQFDFPFEVQVNIPDSIGGPSAGLIFALSIYDTLTKGDLTGGLDIAGTGTTDSEGNIGPIGGIRQKIWASQDAGAKLFLVPPGNCAEALDTELDTDIRLARADTVASAIDSINKFVADPGAELPTCPRDTGSAP